MNAPITIDDCDDDGGVYVDVDKTLDYISGRLTFEEYSSILEQGVKQEPSCDEYESTLSDVQTVIPAPPSSEALPHRGTAKATAPRRPRALPRHLQVILQNLSLIESSTIHCHIY